MSAVQLPRVEIAFSSLSILSRVIEPVATLNITFDYYDEQRGFEAEVFDVTKRRPLALRAGAIRRWGAFDEQYERALFEDAMYAQYLCVREARIARGVVSAADTAEWPRPRTELFERSESGEYVAVVYQAAWFGWKMSRGAQ